MIQSTASRQMNLNLMLKRNKNQILEVILIINRKNKYYKNERCDTDTNLRMVNKQTNKTIKHILYIHQK